MTSSDSDSSGDYESPDPCDSEDDGDTPQRKVFQFTRKLSDRKGKKDAGSPSSLPTMNNVLIESKLSHLDRKKQARDFQQQLKRKGKRDILDVDTDDDSDDSDLELMGKDTGKTNGQHESKGNNKAYPPMKEDEAIELLSSSSENDPLASDQFSSSAPSVRPPSYPSRTAVLQAKAAKPVERIACLSSDDDDSDVEYGLKHAATNLGISTLNNLPPETVAALRRAQESKARLEQAQQYKALDIHVAIQETNLVPTSTPLKRTASHGTNVALDMTSKKANMGQTLNIVCRCGHAVINGIKKPMPKEKQSITLTVREHELLSVLVKKFCAAHQWSHETTTVAMMFDGERLDVGKTPSSYELEDEFLVDFSPSIKSKKMKNVTLGNFLEFTCMVKIMEKAEGSTSKSTGRRTKRQKVEPPPKKAQIEKKTVKCRENEPLQVIVEKLCVGIGNLPLVETKVTIKFDAEALDPSKTPKSYEMMDGDMLEVYIEKSVDW